VVSLRQPTIRRIGGTRPFIESLAAWSGQPKPAYDLLREHWQVSIFPRQSTERSFQTFWDQALQNGTAVVTPTPAKARTFNLEAVRKVLGSLPPTGDGLALVLYPKVGMLDGSHAYNPWLQELPDPVTKVTWDNYACLSAATARELGVSNGDVVRLELPAPDGQTQALELPVFLQPGQHDGVVAVALGYGMQASQRFADIGPPWLEAKPTVGPDGRVGRNASPLLGWEGGTLRYTRGGLKLTRTRERQALATTQAHPTLSIPAHLAPPGTEYGPAIQEVTATSLAKVAAANPAPASEPDLWPDDHPYPTHRWGMVIDLQTCTGCSACVVACQAENNVPVVGKDEVSRHREMHWLRIDRYYSANGADVDVSHQPMLCQHCEHAPCETVCPVLATVHSSEGLNEQVYNRCVGTRYCANNCPYKVRRFNWFAYAHDDTLQNMALNPDVTVRSRGVMEKCSFCVQRIEEARIDAKRRGEELRGDGVKTACQQSCPAQAITFGDVNNPASAVARLRKDRRHYHVLGELNIGPAVGYLKIIRNRPAGREALSHG
jgi:molybdopterin-containing oxidoreductase family iron-sulfur binding subunit